MLLLLLLLLSQRLRGANRLLILGFVVVLFVAVPFVGVSPLVVVVRLAQLDQGQMVVRLQWLWLEVLLVGLERDGNGFAVQCAAFQIARHKVDGVW